MPCHCDGDREDDRRNLQEWADAATRAACDMRTILRKYELEHELCAETLVWIGKHDEADAIRIEQERHNGIREQTRKAALAKLSLDERRVLGL